MVWLLCPLLCYFTLQMWQGSPILMDWFWGLVLFWFVFFLSLTVTWKSVSISSHVEGLVLPDFIDVVWSFFKLFVEGFFSGFWNQIYCIISFVSRAQTFAFPNETMCFLLLKASNLYETIFFLFLITYIPTCTDLYEQFLLYFIFCNVSIFQANIVLILWRENVLSSKLQ